MQINMDYHNFINCVDAWVEVIKKAIVFYRFGKGLDKDNVKGQGFHLIAPWNEKYIYNVRIQEDLSLMDALAKNGLTIKTELSYRYKPVDNMIGLPV